MKPQEIAKWLPFIALVSVAIVAAVYLLFFEKKDTYKPVTNNPQIIYREACMHCHGQNGDGSGLLYPAFDDNLEIKNIRMKIKEGAFLMPAFEYIAGDTLDSLVFYIYNKRYKRN